MKNTFTSTLPDEWAEDLHLLRGFLSSETDCICAMPDHALALLYAHFCNIQAASWLVVNKETAERFREWFYSGDDDAAWS